MIALCPFCASVSCVLYRFHSNKYQPSCRVCLATGPQYDTHAEAEAGWASVCRVEPVSAPGALPAGSIDDVLIKIRRASAALAGVRGAVEKLRSTETTDD